MTITSKMHKAEAAKVQLNTAIHIMNQWAKPEDKIRELDCCILGFPEHYETNRAALMNKAAEVQTALVMRSYAAADIKNKLGYNPETNLQEALAILNKLQYA